MRKIFKITISIPAALGMAVSAYAFDGDASEELCCTSITVGPLASTDGSVMTSHTCDGHYRSWVSIERAADHIKGEKHPFLSGTMKTRFDGDTLGVRTLGWMDEAAHTYKYLNSGYPCMSENRIGIGEATFNGPDTLKNPSSPIRVEELCRLAMQRCRSAREAVLLMGATAEEYGYGDGGECLTVIDENEVWFFEIIGCGKTEKGAAWAAVRIPDDEVSVSANIPRIGRINRSDKKNCLCSDNLEKVALRYGLWDGKTPFSFWRAFRSDYGDGHNYSYREFYILSQLAPSLGLKFGMDELPLSVKPDTKVDVRQVFELLRATYEGSDWDVSRGMTVTGKDGKTSRSPIANPWMTNEMRDMLNSVKPGTAESHRTPSVVWCAYSQVIQLQKDLPGGLGGICWYSVDNPAQSPRIPIFCEGKTLPEAYSRCGQFVYYPDCALWQFRRANRLATVKWTANKEEFLKEMHAVEDTTFARLDSLNRHWDGRASSFDAFTASAYRKAAAKWDSLEERYWLAAWRGF